RRAATQRSRFPQAAHARSPHVAVIGWPDQRTAGRVDVTLRCVTLCRQSTGPAQGSEQREDQRMRPLLTAFLAAGLAACAAADPDPGQTVKITPLGSHAGEFCAFDRALILEDPNGTRLLYDVGRTVRGADDPRLGN